MAILKRIGPLSLGKMMGAICLVLAVVQVVLSIVLNLINPTYFYLPVADGGYWFVVTFPLWFAIYGFIGGVVFAWLYNMFTPLLGGVKVDMEVAIKSDSTEKKRR